MTSRRSESLLVASPAAAAMQRELRRRLTLLLYDESGVMPSGTAIYSLADPRDARLSRYIGQTAQPSRRMMQHLRTARLWLPDQGPVQPGGTAAGHDRARLGGSTARAACRTRPRPNLPGAAPAAAQPRDMSDSGSG